VINKTARRKAAPTPISPTMRAAQFGLFATGGDDGDDAGGDCVAPLATCVCANEDQPNPG
jgi:hypothetical protein